jgi:hypothetical protein
LTAVLGIGHANSQDFEESTAELASSPAFQDLKFDLAWTVAVSTLAAVAMVLAAELVWIAQA